AARGRHVLDEVLRQRPLNCSGAFGELDARRIVTDAHSCGCSRNSEALIECYFLRSADVDVIDARFGETRSGESDAVNSRVDSVEPIQSGLIAGGGALGLRFAVYDLDRGVRNYCARRILHGAENRAAR